MPIYWRLKGSSVSGSIGQITYIQTHRISQQPPIFSIVYMCETKKCICAVVPVILYLLIFFCPIRLVYTRIPRVQWRSNTCKILKYTVIEYDSHLHCVRVYCMHAQAKEIAIDSTLNNAQYHLLHLRLQMVCYVIIIIFVVFAILSIVVFFFFFILCCSVFGSLLRSFFFSTTVSGCV